MEWGSATDGKRIYYAIANANGIAYTLKDGTVTYGGLVGALDTSTGAILWQTADPNPIYVDGWGRKHNAMNLGAVSVANGVVYAGSMGGAPGTGTVATAKTMLAFDAATGKIKWDYASGGSVASGAAIVDGVMYWGSGYSRFGLGDGNKKLYAFTLQR